MADDTINRMPGTRAANAQTLDAAHEGREGSGQRTVEVRPYAERDREDVLALYGQVFGVDAAQAFSARWAWSQRDNLVPDQARQWVLAIRGRVMGFLGTVPQPYLIEGRRVIAHTPSDYMVHPEARFHGIQLMRRFFAESSGCVTCEDIHATIQVTRWLGAHHAGTLVRYVKPLDGNALAGIPGRWGRLPRLVRHAAVRGKDAWDRARRGRDAAADHRVDGVDAFDQRFDAFFGRLSASVPALPQRDRAFLEWRYGPTSPHGDRGIGVVPDGSGGLRGYVVFRRSHGERREGVILDLQALPPDDTGVAGALLDHAMRALKRAGAWKAVFPHLTSGHTTPEAVLRGRGFIPRSGHEMFVSFHDETLTRAADTSAAWNLSYGDMEASHAIP